MVLLRNVLLAIRIVMEFLTLALSVQRAGLICIHLPVSARILLTFCHPPDCGSGWSSPLVLENPAGYTGTSFTPCCAAHDAAYGTCNLQGKLIADAAFRQCMIATCNAAHAAGHITMAERDDDCYFWANTYADAVVSFGGGAFQSSQVAVYIGCR